MVPIRIVISLAVIGTIIALVMFGLQAVEPSVDAARMHGYCDQVRVELESLVQGGVERDVDDPGAPIGTQRVLTLDIPQGCKYVSFGGDPDPDGDGLLQPMVAGTGAVIVYWVQGLGKQVVWMPPEFPGFHAGVFQDGRWTVSSQSFIVHGHGRCRLVFELVGKLSIQYLLVRSG